MLRPSLLMAATLLMYTDAHAQIYQREVGDYSLKFGTSPARSMAQGLVQPATGGSFHGGLDLSSDEGWYVGQWTPSMGLTNPQTREVDTYSGFKQPFDQTLGYEVGLIHYTFPDLTTGDSHEVYAGLTILDSKFGAAYRDEDSQRASTLFANLGGLPMLDLGFTVKVTSHQLTTPFTIGDGSEIRGFNDWSVQLSRAFMGVDLDLIYSGSSLSGADCVAYSGQNAQCDAALMLKAERPLF
ncbi:MAG: TorF family putative porin [Pseudomonas sp.]|uniref:TorF family putative porin n=1 Tax=Pseudomonas abieticivorans TaxID=2931382 RepID=UPI0020BFE46F|nr:TorF family putative porin [Pseudomonas sp. PIA16]MDE1168914.1 TorF family putative porin [Pseudomonas sp.]